MPYFSEYFSTFVAVSFHTSWPILSLLRPISLPYRAIGKPIITPLENTQVGHPYKAVCDTALCLYLIHNEVLILFSYLIHSPWP